METRFQTSFIPKQPFAETETHHSGAGILFLICFLIFIGAVASGAGVYMWDKQIDRKIVDQNKQLTINKNAFDSNTIREITRLDDKLNVADYLLKNHTAVTTLFERVLSPYTLKSVRFTNFSLKNASGDAIVLDLAGTAKDYETLALQANEFTNPRLRNSIKSPIVSSFNLDQTGNVVFSLTTGVDPLLLNYYKLKTEEVSGQQDGTQDSEQDTTENAAATGVTLKPTTNDAVGADQVDNQVPDAAVDNGEEDNIEENQ